MLKVCDKKVLVIGTGPAGLESGLGLCKHGFTVTFFEREPIAGGLLNLIPTRRFNRNYIAHMVKKLTAAGARFEFNKVVDMSKIDALLGDFDFIVLAVGTQKPRHFERTGSRVGEYINSLDYLRGDLRVGSVAVVGGGDVAIDCAVAAVERGAQSSLLYRKTEDKMPAQKKEIAYAKSVGVKFHFEVADFDFPCDVMVVAIGYDTEFHPESDVHKSGRIFVTGDAKHGATNIVTAIYAARKTVEEVLTSCSAARV
jgi:NADPH-dependent glutamate synthase beta subunit-like oxidoreductase